jgi:hypothetical protein
VSIKNQLGWSLLLASFAWVGCSTSNRTGLSKSLEKEPEAMDCPIISLDESAEDCPWAAISRRLVQVPIRAENLNATLEAQAPELWRSIQGDLADRTALGLWGLSQNYESGENASIIDPEIIRGLLLWAGLPPPQDPNQHMVHAGVQHSYGYLLSTLKTPYGFKRQRWVRRHLEAGFKITPGLLGPTPSEGGLLRNISYFFGRIAFREIPSQVAALEEIQVPLELKSYPYGSLKITRIKETILVSKTRTLQLYTDLVRWLGQTPDPTMTHLLVYSYQDNLSPKPILITGFPMKLDAADALLKADRFGTKQLIKPRYNVFISGVTDVKAEWPGSREVFISK